MTDIKNSNSLTILSKLFRSEKYMNDFLDGKIYMNCLGYFKKVEAGEEQNTVKDSKEAVVSHLQPQHVLISMTSPSGQKFEIDSKDLSGPVIIQDDRYNNLKICCFYSPTIDFDNFADSINQTKISFEMEKDFGSFVVIVLNFSEFINRLSSKVDYKNILGLKFRSVDYYDSSFHGEFDLESVPFKKSNRFNFQKESRIIIKTESHDDKPLIVDIGDIRDICAVMKVDDFNRLEFSKFE